MLRWRGYRDFEDTIEFQMPMSMRLGIHRGFWGFGDSIELYDCLYRRREEDRDRDDTN